MVQELSQFAASDMNIFVVTDSRLLGAAVSRLFRKRAGIHVAEVSRGRGLTWERIAASQCEIVLADCSSLGHDTKLMSDLCAHIPQIKIVVFGMNEDPDVFLSYAFLGVSGFVLKEAPASEIIAAVREVAEGEAACPLKFCTILLKHVSHERSKRSEASSPPRSQRRFLTYRQLELLNLVAKGLTNKEIGATLNLSEFTVKNHVRRIMRRVGVGNRHEAVQVIRGSGFLQGPEQIS
jgi:DNA-binding NarL/FixJ family response regulator